MSGTAASGLGEAGRRQLLALLARIAAVANRVRPTARLLTGIASLSALWLAFQIQVWTGASNLVAGILLLVLAVPALVVGWLWWLLVDVCELPQIAERLLGQRAPEAVAVAQDQPAVRDAFRLGGSLREAATLAWEFEGLRGVIVGVLLLANPLFLAVVALALAATVLLGLVAAVTGLGVLLF